MIGSISKNSSVEWRIGGNKKSNLGLAAKTGRP
jgi:hypothetical protein